MFLQSRLKTLHVMSKLLIFRADSFKSTFRFLSPFSLSLPPFHCCRSGCRLLSCHRWCVSPDATTSQQREDNLSPITRPSTCTHTLFSFPAVAPVTSTSSVVNRREVEGGISNPLCSVQWWFCSLCLRHDGFLSLSQSYLLE